MKKVELSKKSIELSVMAHTIFKPYVTPEPIPIEPEVPEEDVEPKEEEKPAEENESKNKQPKKAAKKVSKKPVEKKVEAEIDVENPGIITFFDLLDSSEKDVEQIWNESKVVYENLVNDTMKTISADYKKKTSNLEMEGITTNNLSRKERIEII